VDFPQPELPLKIMIFDISRTPNKSFNYAAKQQAIQVYMHNRKKKKALVLSGF
jgi:hypothetical protein